MTLTKEEIEQAVRGALERSLNNFVAPDLFVESIEAFTASAAEQLGGVHGKYGVTVYLEDDEGNIVQEIKLPIKEV